MKRRPKLVQDILETHLSNLAPEQLQLRATMKLSGLTMIAIKIMTAVLFFVNADFKVGHASFVMQMYRLATMIVLQKTMAANYRGFFVTMESMINLTADLAVIAAAIAAMVSMD